MARKTLRSNIYRLAYTNLYHLFSPYFIENCARWKKLRNSHEGERVFLVANGPSLNVTPLYLLKNEHTIMFNRIRLMLERLNYVPTYYMVADGLAGRTMKEDIRFFTENCRAVFTPDINKGDLVKFTDFVPFAGKDNVLYMYEVPWKFSNRLPFVNIGGTVIVAAFQVLKYLGYSEIIVVGNDMNYVIHESAEVTSEEKKDGKTYQDARSTADDDPNHFDPRYFGKGREFHQPTRAVLDHIFRSLEMVSRVCAGAGIRIVNAGYDSRVKCFETADFYEALGYGRDRIDELFGDLLSGIGFDSVGRFLEKAVEVGGPWTGDLDIACAGALGNGGLVKDKIRDYLPVGPYGGRIYFVNRKLLKDRGKA